MRKVSAPKSSLTILAVAALAVGLWPRPAQAYIDPGTGSFVVQGIIAAVVGASFALKVFWRRIVSKITGKPLPGDDDDQ